MAGPVYTSNPTPLEPYQPQDSDLRDDLAQSHTLRCLDAFAEDTHQIMMVISSLLFGKYLDKSTGAVHAAAKRLPNAEKLPEPLRRGESDILILHQIYGIIIGEVKSVGADRYFGVKSAADQQQIIVSVRGQL